MPIELWWWVKPLFATGALALIFVGVPGFLLWDVSERRRIPEIMMALAIAPWAICFVSTFVWVLINLLILIWR